MLICKDTILAVSIAIFAVIPSVGIARAQDTVSQQFSTTVNSAVIASFKENPASWLASAKNGSVILSVQVRDLVLSDPSLIKQMISLAKNADPLQKSNLGVGLAQAALQFVKNNDGADATAIQQQIVLAGDDALFRSFTAGSNAVETASLGAPGVGAGGGVGSSGGTGGTAPSLTAPIIPTLGTTNTVTTFSTSTAAVPTTSFSASTGSTSSVSPTL